MLEEEWTMTRKRGLVVVMLAVLWLIPGSPALAQSGSGGLTEQQRREMEQKYQEQWETLEKIQQRQEDTGRRLQEAEKRRLDAAKRQREAERRLQELEQQPKK
jgi:hypothetical protein